MNRILSLICTGLLALCGVATSEAATYYVSTTGNDSNAGTTTGAPWRTIGKASQTMVAGDTAFIRGGTYSTEVTIRFPRSGTQANPIILKNYPNETPIVAWSNSTDSDHRIYMYSGSLSTAISDITIEGIETSGGWEAIKIDGGLRIVIRGNNFHDGIHGGLLAHGLNITVDGNIFRRNGNAATCSGFGTPNGCNIFHGMYITGTGWIVTNNLVYDNTASGIQLAGYPYVVGEMPSASYSGFQGLIAHNTIAYQRHGSGMFIWTAGGSVTNTTIENNIFYENAQLVSGSAQGPAYISCDSCTGTVRNNMWYGTGTSVNFSNSSGSDPPSGMTTTGTSNQAPLFINAPATVPALADFHLTSTSPALNAGFVEALVAFDFSGNARPQSTGYDIGAYERTTVGNTYYVRTNGSNVNTGTIDSSGGAWLTLQKAAATMVCGDTTFVHGGTYTQSGQEILFSKTTNCNGSKITLRNFPGEVPHQQWASKTDAANRFRVDSGNPTIPVFDVTIQGITMSNGWECVKTSAVNRFTFKRNVCHDTQNNGFTGSGLGGSYKTTVTQNYFYNICDPATPQPYCHGMYITGQKFTVTHNVFWNVKGIGLQLDALDYTIGQMPSANYARFQGIVANNTIAYSDKGSAMNLWTGFGGGLAGTSFNTKIINNIAYMNNVTSGSGSAEFIAYLCNGCQATVSNNLWYTRAGSNNRFSISQSGATPVGVTESGNLNQAPSFLNAPPTLPVSPNFKLATNSPGGSSGVNQYGVLFDTDMVVDPVDVDDASRPTSGPWSMGSYESSADTTPPANPVGLAVN